MPKLLHSAARSFLAKAADFFCVPSLGCMRSPAEEAILSPTQCDGRAFVCRRPRFLADVSALGDGTFPPAPRFLCLLFVAARRV